MAQRAHRAGARLALAIGALALSLTAVSGLAQAQPSRSLAAAERDRRAAESEARRLRSEAEAARRETAALDQRLVDAGQRRAEAEAAALAAETRLAALRLRLQADGARYRAGRDGFESALIAAAFAGRRAEPSAARIGLFARAAAPALQSRIADSARALDDGARLETAIAEEQHLLAEAEAAIEAERADVETLLAQRRAVAATLTASASAAERRARQYAAEARSLRELAARVQQPAARPGRATAAAIPAAWLAPANGRVLTAFGARPMADSPAAQGTTLRTRPGAQVVAPANGQVAYAGLFRSYGQVLILNLDNGYAVVLAGMGGVRARVGETIVAGQPIGEMGAGDAAGADTPSPDLYIEVRRNGQPIDPARWLAARGLTADRTAGQAG